jgi:hypothetical protein
MDGIGGGDLPDLDDPWLAADHSTFVEMRMDIRRCKWAVHELWRKQRQNSPRIQGF